MDRIISIEELRSRIKELRKQKQFAWAGELEHILVERLRRGRP